MLTVTILGDEYFDETNEEFVYPESIELQLEHSLVSLSKWEAEFQKPFLGKEARTDDEALGYIHAMIITPDLPREVLRGLTQQNIEEIDAYINRKMTATWFREIQGKASNEVITNELIYYWMSSLDIPQECETWHLARLFTRIKVHSEKNAPEKKMSKQQQAQDFKRLNAERRAKYNSRG